MERGSDMQQFCLKNKTWIKERAGIERRRSVYVMILQIEIT